MKERVAQKITKADPSDARRVAILEAATKVFLRYGFKKTSMDDLARAADLSRQGLYLHYATKEALFVAVVLQMIEAMREAARAALAREDLDAGDRVLAAFDAIHGEKIGVSGVEHGDELIEAAKALVGPVVDNLDEELTAEIARVLKTSGVAAEWKDAGLSAKDLAENLFSTSYGVKHLVKTSAAYHERMKIAVQLVCRDKKRSRKS